MLCSIHRLMSKSHTDNQQQSNPMNGFSRKTIHIKLIEIQYSEYESETEKLGPLIQCCKGDLLMVFAIAFDKHKHLYNNIVRLISCSPSQKYSHSEITILRFGILQGQYGSVNMVKYLSTQYNDQALIHCLELTDCNTNTLLIQIMKSGNNGIIRAVLKHCKKNDHAPLHAGSMWQLQSTN